MKTILSTLLLCSILSLGYTQGSIVGAEKINQNTVTSFYDSNNSGTSPVKPASVEDNSNQVKSEVSKSNYKVVAVRVENPDTMNKAQANTGSSMHQGFYMIFHSNGNILERGTMNQNYNVDSLKRFYENGILKYEANYNAYGQEHGDVKYYFQNGNPEFVYYSVNGYPLGEAKRYLESGELKEVIIYGEGGRVLHRKFPIQDHVVDNKTTNKCSDACRTNKKIDPKKTSKE